MITATLVNIIIGTFNKKIQPHHTWSKIQPPKSGPIGNDNIVPIIRIETALDLSSPEKTTGRIAVDKVITKAAAIPNSTLPMTNTSVVGANAHTNELKANKIKALNNIILHPKRSPNQ